jgi:hypothetical protein
MYCKKSLRLRVSGGFQLSAFPRHEMGTQPSREATAVQGKEQTGGEKRGPLVASDEPRRFMTIVLLRRSPAVFKPF